MYSMKDAIAAELGVSLPGRKIQKAPLKRPAARAAVIVEADIEAPKRLDNNSEIGVDDGDDGTQASEETDGSGTNDEGGTALGAKDVDNDAVESSRDLGGVSRNSFVCMA